MKDGLIIKTFYISMKKNAWDNSKSYAINNVLINWAENSKNEKIIIPAGANLPNFNLSNNTFVIKDEVFKLQKPITLYEPTRNNIILLANEFLNCPYLWGGKTALGIDCSGLTQVVYKIIGIQLPRNAYQQAESGKLVSFIEEAKPGDLMFFDNAEGKIIHVGIYLGNHKIIHASGKVRIDSIDNHGIYKEEAKRYSHTLRIIKRILND
ncbi:MAG: C40 family peptidase [Bacteroidales bacterium]|nr:C40 family peptidase [Bacteroidales bacterium]